MKKLILLLFIPTIFFGQTGGCTDDQAINYDPTATYDDIFNISFTSEDVQDLRVRIMNIIGEELIIDDMQ
tara:strand:- start:413 stop:622 length:210 start_codon:yes stop_codon:yes gene_type:complete